MISFQLTSLASMAMAMPDNVNRYYGFLNPSWTGAWPDSAVDVAYPAYTAAWPGADVKVDHGKKKRSAFTVEGNTNQVLAFTHFAWIGPNKLGEINHDSLVQNIWFLCQTVLLSCSLEGLKIFHFSQEFNATHVMFSVNIQQLVLWVDTGQLSPKY